MSAVTNQPPYQKLEPLPLPKEACPTLRKLASKTLLVFTLTLIAIGFGMTLSLSGLNVTMEMAAVVAGLIGLIAGVALAALMRFPSKTEEYRLNTLQQIESVTSSDRALRALRQLKDFFYYPFSSFAQCFHHHVLHNELTAITMRLTPDRPDVRKVWHQFLKHLDQTPVKNPGGEEVKFDVSPELELLQGQQMASETQWLSSWGSTYWDDLAQIEELQKVSFGKIGTFSKERMHEVLSKNKKSGCVVARRRGQNEILGFAWYFENEGKIELAGLARKPGAASLRIGNDLLYAVLKQFKPKDEVILHVRKSNPAVHLYKNWGFVISKEIPHYYNEGPAENAYLMQLNWEEYQKFYKRVNTPR